MPTIGLGLGLDKVRLGSKLNYNPATDDDVNLLINSRTGLTLNAEIGDNAALKMPMVDASRVDATHALKMDTGITPVQNTVIAFKGRATINNAAHAFGLQTDTSKNFYFGLVAATFKWQIGWADKSAVSANQADTDYHVFIVYNGSAWIRPANTLLTDASILNVINTVAADCTVASPTWATLDRTLFLGSLNAGYNYGAAFAYSDFYIGTITTGVITWQKKYILNNIYKAYDLINANNSGLWVNAFGITPTNPTLLYNEHGSHYCLDNGHTLLQKDTKTFVSVPYLLDGNPNHTVTNPTGFATVKDFAGNTMLNYTDCIIRFVGAQFDRSNVTLFSAEARAAISRYDFGNVNDWHITELNRNWLDTWQNADYEGTKFIKTDSNSMQLETASNVLEIFTLSVNKAGADFDKILKYCGDYDLYYFPLWDKRRFLSADITKRVLNRKINTNQEETSSTFGNVGGIFPFGVPVLAPNGMIYAPPFAQNKMLKINSSNDSASLIADAEFYPVGFDNTNWKWSAFVLATNGVIYGVPYMKTSILKLDPVNDMISYTGTFASTVQKWGSGTMAGNGFIYFIPHCYGKVLKFNPVTELSSEIGDFPASTINGAEGFVKWGAGILAPNGSIYCMPYFYKSILKINTADDTTELIGDYGGAVKWVSGVLAPGGIIYGMPYNDGRILKIDTNTDTVTFISTGLASGSGKEYYGGCVLAANGIIYGIPATASQILRFDPATEQVSFFDDYGTDEVKWVGGVLAMNGAIYAPPRHSDTTAILKILSEYSIDKNIALS